MAILFINIKHAIPQTPGVYFFRDKKNAILYIGKAANLRARLSSYFVKSAVPDAAKKEMLRKAEHITWQEATSEIEALLEEARLIKKYLPPYNVVLRDDKQYLFVGFTKEQFPRIVFTHQPVHQALKNRKHRMQEKRKRIEYIGPFTEAGVVKRMVRSLRKTFPYCACVRPHSRMCQNAELALCMGFCCVITGSASRDERVAYAKNIRYLKNLLSGRQKQLAHRLRAEMNKKSKQQDYEAAARLRNQLFALERIFAHQHVLKRDYKAENQKGLHELVLLLGLAQYPERIEGYDISNIQGAFAVGSMVVFTDGTANRQEYRTFRIRTVIGANDTAMMRETLMRRFTHNEWPLPNVILIDGGRGQLNAAIKALASTPSYKASRSTVISIAKREEELYAANRKTPYTLKTMPPALLYLLQQIRNEAHRFAISHYRRRHRQAMREKA